MLAPSPPMFSTFGWRLDFENLITTQPNTLYTEIDTPDILLDSPIPPLPESRDFGWVGSGDSPVLKKLNHNASERNRRKRVNNLYSSLFSLLPAADQLKKLSIPATISRVVKYIPELQNEVQRLYQVKEELSSKISRQQGLASPKKGRKCNSGGFLPVVSTSSLGDNEAVIQISTVKINECSISDPLQCLEEDGIFLINGSSFESFGDRVFHNLHLQVRRNSKMDFQMLREKLLSMYDKREEQLFSELGSEYSYRDCCKYVI